MNTRHTSRRVASARYAALSNGEGVPHPVLDRGMGGYPIQSWPGGYPIHSCWGRYPRIPPIQTWDGYPLCPDLEWDTPLPHSDLGWSTPHPHPDLGWGTPRSRRMGYPSLSAGWGPPPVQTWDGVHPPPPKVGQTHTCENISSRRTTYAGGNYQAVKVSRGDSSICARDTGIQGA